MSIEETNANSRSLSVVLEGANVIGSLVFLTGRDFVVRIDDEFRFTCGGPHIPLFAPARFVQPSGEPSAACLESAAVVLEQIYRVSRLLRHQGDELKTRWRDYRRQYLFELTDRISVATEELRFVRRQNRQLIKSGGDGRRFPRSISEARKKRRELEEELRTRTSAFFDSFPCAVPSDLELQVLQVLTSNDAP